MKPPLLPALLGSLLFLTACDQAADEARKAAQEAAAAAERAAAEAKAAAPDLKTRAAEALKSVKSAGSEAYGKSRELAGGALDWTQEKLGIPEADGVLDSFKALFLEAKQEVTQGMTPEKAQALRKKWDDMTVRTEERLRNLAPEQQARAREMLERVRNRWDELLRKSEKGTIE